MSIEVTYSNLTLIFQNQYLTYEQSSPNLQFFIAEIRPSFRWKKTRLSPKHGQRFSFQ